MDEGRRYPGPDILEDNVFRVSRLRFIPGPALPDSSHTASLSGNAHSAHLGYRRHRYILAGDPKYLLCRLQYYATTTVL